MNTAAKKRSRDGDRSNVSSFSQSDERAEKSHSRSEKTPVADEQQADVKGVSKGLFITAAGALLGNKKIRRKVVKSLMKRKKIRKSARKVVRALIKQKLVSKKDVKKLAGKNLAKKLAA